MVSLFHPAKEQLFDEIDLDELTHKEKIVLGVAYGVLIATLVGAIVWMIAFCL